MIYFVSVKHRRNWRTVTKLHTDIERILIEAETIQRRVDELAARINADLTAQLRAAEQTRATQG